MNFVSSLLNTMSRPSSQQQKELPLLAPHAMEHDETQDFGDDDAHFQAVVESARGLVGNQDHVFVIRKNDRMLIDPEPHDPDDPVSHIFPGSIVALNEQFEGSFVRLCWIFTVLHMSATDVIMVGTGKSKHDAANAWRNLPADHKMELRPFTDKFQFSGIDCFCLSYHIQDSETVF